MEIGFAVPVSGSWSTRDNLVRVATRAEELGYGSLWTFQRLLSPVDGTWGEMYRSVQDPLVILGFLAAVTTRPRLGVAVVNLPFVAPALLAKQAATIDVVSGGRLDLGLGLGWSDEEFAATGAAKARRGARAEEYVSVLRTLWTDTPAEHHGRFYTVPRMTMDPKPLQRPYPPILLGGSAPAALRRAGRLADGWVSSSQADPATLGATVAAVAAAATEAGRDPARLRLICRAAVKLRPAGSPERRPLTGTVDEVRGDLAEIAAQGITELFVDLNFDPQVGSPDADPAASMAHAEEALDGFAPRSTRP